MLTGATLELNIADYNKRNNIKINSLLFDKPDEAFAAAEAGRCDGYTDDGGSRRGRALDHEEARRLDDPARADLARSRSASTPARATRPGRRCCSWTHYAMLSAEEIGVTKANVDR